VRPLNGLTLVGEFIIEDVIVINGSFFPSITTTPEALTASVDALHTATLVRFMSFNLQGAA
jgi:hypothetical protein